MIINNQDIFESNVLLLCEKVREVIDNNDWPTEEGQDRADEPPSVIRRLVNAIEDQIK